jgi:hypothetical protein
MVEDNKSKNSGISYDPNSGEAAAPKSSRSRLDTTRIWDRSGTTIPPVSYHDPGFLYDESEIRKFNPVGYDKFLAYKWSAAIITAIVIPLGILSMGSPSSLGLGRLFFVGFAAAVVLASLMIVEQRKARKAHISHEKNTFKQVDELPGQSTNKSRPRNQTLKGDVA